MKSALVTWAEGAAVRQLETTLERLFSRWPSRDRSKFIEVLYKFIDEGKKSCVIF